MNITMEAEEREFLYFNHRSKVFFILFLFIGKKSFFLNHLFIEKE